MKILYFVHGFPPSIGAGAINAYEIAKYLGEFGHNILVLSPGVFSKSNPMYKINKKTHLDLTIKYSSKLMKIPLNLVFSHFENMLKFFLKFKSTFNPDLVLSQYSAYQYASVVGGFVSKILKIPHIIRSHDIFFLSGELPFYQKYFHSLIYPGIYNSILNSNIFYVTTSEMRKYFINIKKLQDIKFKIHHNGVDIKTFFPFKTTDKLKDEYGCNKIILFIGNIAQDYGLQNIIKIFPKLLKDHKDTHFLIIGEGPFKHIMLDLIKKLDLRNNIHFLGSKPHTDIPFYINNSDIGIGLLSNKIHFRYTIPVKCLEYMACKKPFITTPCSEDIIKNNDVGILLNKNFIEEDLKTNLLSLIEDENLAKKLGENGLTKINEQFLWEDLMRNFDNDLNQLISK